MNKDQQTSYMTISAAIFQVNLG